MSSNASKKSIAIRSLVKKKQIKHQEESSPIEILHRNEGENLFPASPVQEWFWLLHSLNPQSAGYLLVEAYDSVKKIDLKKLYQSMKQILIKNEILRTTFKRIDDKIFQCIKPVESFSDEWWFEEDFSRIKSLEEESEIHFDLTSGPLFKIKILHKSADQCVVLFIFHHIVVDGHTVSLFLEDLKNAYLGQPIASNSYQYVDAITWMKNNTIADKNSKNLNFWKKYLKNAPNFLSLPGLGERNVAGNSSEESFLLVIPTVKYQKIQTIIRDWKLSMYTFLSASFIHLLSFYSSESDIVLGVPVSHRNRKEWEKVYGCLVTSLPIRTNWDNSKSFSSNCKQFSENSMIAMSHSEISFGELVKELQPPRIPGINPFYQFLFTYVLDDEQSFESPNFLGNPISIKGQAALFDIYVMATEVKGSVSIKFCFDRSLFSNQYIDSFCSHFNQIVESVLENPDILCSEIQIIKDKEKQRILQSCYNNYSKTTETDDYYELFYNSACNNKEKPALTTQKGTYSYGQLIGKVDEFATYISKNIVTNDNPIALLFSRTEELIFSILACLKIGLPYLPVDKSFPSSRIQYMLDDSNVAGILYDDEDDFTALSLNIDSGILLHSTEINNEVPNNSEYYEKKNIHAYTLYTSGSTGKPKGVMISQKNLYHFVKSASHKLPINQDSAFAALTSISFDISILEILVPLALGGQSFLFNEQEILDPNLLLKTITEKQINIMQLTPSRYRQLFMLQNNKVPPLVKNLLIGAEPFSDELLKHIQNTFQGEIFNLYGPTEATVYASIANVTKANNITLGEPLLNNHLYVLNKHKQIVPVSIPGEIYICGENVGIGYCNKPDLTNAAFLEDPFFPEKRMYKTGDQAIRLSDGRIRFLERFDNQIKLNGYRIEPGEIEAVLELHPDILTAIVTLEDDISLEEQLAIFYTSKTGSIESQVLREWLSSHLPSYMIPSFYIYLESFPLNSNGKIDRSALHFDPEEILQPDVSEELTLIEEIVITIWEEVLGLHNIKSSSNFFQLGGHSLLVVQILSQITQQFEIEFSFDSFLQNPTPRKMSDRIKTILLEEISLKENN